MFSGGIEVKALDRGSSDFYWGGIRDYIGNNEVYYFYHSSVFDNSVRGRNYSYYYAHAVSQWQNTSSKVNLYYRTSGRRDTYYVGDTTSTAIGRMIPYNRLGHITCLNCDWGSTRLYLYDNNIRSNSWTYTNILATATHEVGHSLKLKHPPSGTHSIMRQGRKDFTSSTSTDKRNLRRKWGN